MADIKTRANDGSVSGYIGKIEDTGRREDCIRISEIMQELTGETPRMWGDSIVGFGDYHYKYASGREGDWFLCGFSSRKQYLTLYIMAYVELYPDVLKRLGKHKQGKGCLYIKRLSDVDTGVLRELISTSIARASSESP